MNAPQLSFAEKGTRSWTSVLITLLDVAMTCMALAVVIRHVMKNPSVRRSDASPGYSVAGEEDPGASLDTPLHAFPARASERLS